LTEECKTFLKQLPKTEVRGWLQTTVSDTDQRPVYVFFHNRPIKRKIPWLYFNGGPMEADHTLPHPVAAHFPETRASSPLIIFMDQRGTGCSSPLSVQRENVLAYMDWGSHGIVRDSEALRKALHYAKWNIVGQSFGGLIVSRYLTDSPESVNKAISHGYALPTEQTKDLVERTLGQEQLIAAYFKKYPDDVAAIKHMTAFICQAQKNQSADCPGTILSTYALPYFQWYLWWPKLHTALQAWMSSKLDAQLASIKSPVIKSSTPPGKSTTEIPIPANLNDIATIEAADRGAEEFYDRKTCEDVEGRLQTAYGTDLFDNFLECASKEFKDTLISPGPEFDALETLFKPYAVNIADLAMSLVRHPEIRFFLTGSRYDYFTNFEKVRAEAETLGTLATFVPLENSGHEGFSTEPKFLELMKEPVQK
jgi:pimeloyl-ACP methyl ester carboxylesterase